MYAKGFLPVFPADLMFVYTKIRNIKTGGKKENEKA